MIKASLKIISWITFVIMSCFIFASDITEEEEEEKQRVNIYGWAEYVSPTTLNEFTEKTNISAVYDAYDSEEIMNAKMMSGNTGYDIVFPSNSEYLTRQINLGLYMPLDKKKIPNYKNLDEKILKILQRNDKGNTYVVPWMWSPIGIAYDVEKIKAIDPDAPVNSLEIIFNPEYAKKFEKCGVFWFNSGPEMIGLALLYLGKDPNDTKEANLELAVDLIQSVKKYVRSVSNTEYMDFENNNICITIGFAAEIAQHAARLKSSQKFSHKQFKIVYPQEGFFVSVEGMAIPAKAKNIENAYKFINFLLEPQVAAHNSNEYTQHMNANKASYSMLKSDIIDNEALNISPQIVAEKGFVLLNKTKEFIRKRNREWTFILSD